MRRLGPEQVQSPIIEARSTDTVDERPEAGVRETAARAGAGAVGARLAVGEPGLELAGKPRLAGDCWSGLGLAAPGVGGALRRGGLGRGLRSSFLPRHT
jgi:hypothetical protein